MRLCPERRGQRVSLKLTAMIDVVFLLIIFFMTVSTLNRDVIEELPLPEATHGKLVRDRQGRIVINVRDDGRVVVGKQVVAAEWVREMLRSAVQQNGAEHVTCVMRVDRRTPFHLVQTLMGDLAQSGIWRVSYSVVEQDA